MTTPLPTDTIEIRGLRTDAIIGVLPDERERRQPLILQITLFTEVATAAATGRLEDTVDYARVAERSLAFLASSRFGLLESLAENLAGILLDEFPVDAISLTIEKPEAVPEADTIALTITRHRSE